MANTYSDEERGFLNDLDRKLWNAADRLRSNLETAVFVLAPDRFVGAQARETGKALRDILKQIGI